jgi:antitoxin YefM
MTNGAKKFAPFGGDFAGEKGVFLQLQRRSDRRCAASSRSVPWNDGLDVLEILDTHRLMLYSNTYITETPMDAITYTTVRANLASAMDRVCNDHEALIITRNGEQSVVMLSLEDFKALEETAYLLRTPANARRLLSAVAQLNAGKGVARKLTK